jgi:hypothetical protein
MIVIVVAVITQGFRVPSESRGEVKSLLFVNSGFFQAVGVISFGMISKLNCADHPTQLLTVHSICLPYVVLVLIVIHIRKLIVSKTTTAF